jgi:protein-disulfide isomerase
MTQVSGRQVLTAAGIVGGAVILGSLVLALSLDRTARRLDEIRAAVVDASGALSKLQLAAAPAAKPQAADPDRRYAINVAGAPALGPKTAAVTIAEFADFQ